jgi:hypothetical protein
MKAGEPARDHRDRLRGFTQHESECGGRTDACSACGASVRLKDMEVHMQLHRHQGSVPLAGAAPSSGSSPKQGRAASTMYTAQAMDAAALEGMRARAWARAGFPSDDPAPTAHTSAFQVPPEYGDVPRAGARADAAEDAALQAALRMSLETAQASERAAPRRVCANANCAVLLPGTGPVLCSPCAASVGAVGVGPSTQAPLLPLLVKRYFLQLTTGCGQESCSNSRCVSSGQQASLSGV